MSTVFNSIDVGGVIRGSAYKNMAAVDLASTANSNWTTSASAAFSAPTLTISGLTSGASLGRIDGVEAAVGNRILLKDMATLSAGAAAAGGFNGVYDVTGGTATTLTLTRSYDMQAGDNPVGAAIWVKAGTVNATTAWASATSVTIADATTPVVGFGQYDVYSTLSLARGGTGTSSLTTGNRIVQTNSGATALATTTTPVVTALNDTNNVNILKFTPTASAVNAVLIKNQATGVAPVIAASGEADIGLTITDSNSNNMLTMSSVASAVNGLNITNAASGNAPILQAAGAANVGMLLRDSNANAMVTLSTVASAVNSVKITSGATTVGPTLETVGETNVDFKFKTAGTGVFNFDAGSASAAATIQLQDNTGGQYAALTVPGTVATSYTLTLPTTVGTSGQVLTTDGSNPATLSWSSVAVGREFSLLPLQAAASSTTATSVAYFAWNNSILTGYTTRTVRFWYSSLTNRDVTVRLYNLTGATSLGTVTITSGTADGMSSFTFTDPGADGLLALQISKSANAGTNPNVYGAWMTMA